METKLLHFMKKEYHENGLDVIKKLEQAKSINALVKVRITILFVS